MAEETFPTRLWTLADLYTPMAVRVAATLRVADHIAAGIDSVQALAERTSTDPDALGRLVAHLVSVGVLDRNAGDTLSLTELGAELCEGHPADGRAWLDITGAVGRADLAAMHLLDAVRTGQPAYPLTYGRGYWDDLAADPRLSDSFDRLMGSRLRFEVPAIVAGYDWGTVDHLIDVGGGDGTLLAAILAAHPTMRGTLVELPGPAAGGRRRLAEAGVSDRSAVVAGSFFDRLPPGADAYLLSGVLHDWDDEPATAILGRCAEAVQSTTGRVLVVDELHQGTGDAGSWSSTEMNLRMLTYTGGRERTLAEIETLAARVGLRVHEARRVTAYRTVIELRGETGPR